MNSIKYKNKEYKTGESIIFNINDSIIRGKLNISKDSIESSSYLSAHVCHNNNSYDGSQSNEMFGYKYSWSFSICKTDTDVFSGSDVRIISHDIIGEDKENYEISDEISHFLSTQELEVVSLFFERDSIFPKYNKIEISEKSGYVKLIDTIKNRFVDIKFGRFLTTLNKEIEILRYTNKDIEKFYNNFLAYQKNAYIEVVELKGKDLLEAYKLENYLHAKSSLAGSCMTDKTDILKLYTSNPEIISLLAIKTFGKIAGRCLIWNTSEGKIMDKRYTCSDWVNSKFDKIMKEDGYICNSTLDNYPICKKINIQLDNYDLEKYPYLDTFKFFDKNTGLITNALNEDLSLDRTKEDREIFIQLTTTNGEYHEL
jgi:hypothetical protein